MFPILWFTLICVALTSILFIVGQILPTHNIDMEKSSPYECGFDPMKSSRLPFSFRFFLIALLFLLFDLEMALLLPLPFSTVIASPDNSSYPLMLFMMILSLGLYYEWVNGGLDWAKN